MKVIVQICCLNEEATLPVTLRDIPRQFPGVDVVEVLIVDDGSVDRTVEVARELGVEHIVQFRRNRGLAAAYAAGLDACLRLGADIIVNTDGDNQYAGADIALVVAPIVEGHADIVIGDRQIDTIEHFSLLKKGLQKLGSWVVRQASRTSVPDATSGLRAYSREAAMRLNVVGSYSASLELIIQAGSQRLAIAHVPIRTNPVLRESRLMRSMWHYVSRQSATITRIYTMYHPLPGFLTVGLILLLVGLGLSLRYVYFMIEGQGGAQGHIQSVILAGVLLTAGIQIMLIGMVADLIAVNRRLIESALLRIKRLEFGERDHDEQ